MKNDVLLLKKIVVILNRIEKEINRMNARMEKIEKASNRPGRNLA